MPDRGRERFLASWGMWFHATASGRGGEADGPFRSNSSASRANWIIPTFCSRPITPRFRCCCGWPISPGSMKRHTRSSGSTTVNAIATTHIISAATIPACARDLSMRWDCGVRDFLEQAQSMAWQSVEDARQLGHAFSLAHSLQRCGMTMILLKDWCRLPARLGRALSPRRAQQISLAACRCDLSAGLAGRTSGRLHEAGIEQMAHGVNHPFFAGFRPIFLPQIAEQELRAGRADQAMATIERAATRPQNRIIGFASRTFFACAAKSCWRNRATMREAEAAFREAMTMAAQQSCRPLELRAATSLARLLGDSGRATEARDALAPIYAPSPKASSGRICRLRRRCSLSTARAKTASASVACLRCRVIRRRMSAIAGETDLSRQPPAPRLPLRPRRNSGGYSDIGKSRPPQRVWRGMGLVKAHNYIETDHSAANGGRVAPRQHSQLPDRNRPPRPRVATSQLL